MAADTRMLAPNIFRYARDFAVVDFEQVRLKAIGMTVPIRDTPNIINRAAVCCPRLYSGLTKSQELGSMISVAGKSMIGKKSCFRFRPMEASSC